MIHVSFLLHSLGEKKLIEVQTNFCLSSPPFSDNNSGRFYVFYQATTGAILESPEKFAMLAPLGCPMDEFDRRFICSIFIALFLLRLPRFRYTYVNSKAKLQWQYHIQSDLLV